MTMQKCIILFEDGTEAVFVGEVQYDEKKRKKIRKVQFTVPIEKEVKSRDEEVVEKLFGMFGMKG